MTIHAFKDAGDGYYQIDIQEGEPLPEWTKALTPCAVQAPVAVVSVPPVVSRFQARAALHLAGLLDDVEALMSAPDTPALAKLAWADAMEFERQSPTIAALAGAVGLTEQDIDALFITAAGIKA